MSIDLPLERRLHDLYAVSVPPALDRHIASTIASTPARRPSHVRTRKVAVLAMVAVLATVAAGPAATWFAGWDERHDRLWELGVPVEGTVTADGYRVTAHRAYADPLGVRIAMSVVDLEGRWSDFAVEEAHATDADGRVYEGWNWSNTQTPADATSASWSRFALPGEVADGDLHLDVTVTSLAVRAPEPIDLDRDLDIWTSVAGTWTFQVDVPFTTANTIKPVASVSQDGVTITLEELGVVPSGTIARLAVTGLPALPAGSDRGWYPTLSAVHDGQRLYDDTFDPGVLTDGDEILIEILPVVDDLTGHWTITIFGFWSSADLDRELLDESLGPWVLEFDVPPAS